MSSITKSQCDTISKLVSEQLRLCDIDSFNITIFTVDEKGTIGVTYHDKSVNDHVWVPRRGQTFRPYAEGSGT